MQVLASQLHFLANRNPGLAIPPLFWPVNCIKIAGHVGTAFQMGYMHLYSRIVFYVAQHKLIMLYDCILGFLVCIMPFLKCY